MLLLWVLQKGIRMKRLLTVLLITLFIVGSGLTYADVAFEYPTDLERDPFDALIDANGVLNVRLIRAEADMKITGLVYSDDSAERIVIINNEVLRENGVIGAYTVKKILPNRVVLQKNDKEVILKMGGSDED